MEAITTLGDKLSEYEITNTFSFYQSRTWSETKTWTLLFTMFWTHQSGHATSVLCQWIGITGYQWGWSCMVVKVTKGCYFQRLFRDFFIWCLLIVLIYQPDTLMSKIIKVYFWILCFIKRQKKWKKRKGQSNFWFVGESRLQLLNCQVNLKEG